MSTETREIRSTRYVVDIFTLIINDEPVSIDPKFISGINIEKDFDNDILPVFEFTFACNDELYYKIIENKEHTKFRVRMMKYEYDYSNKIRAKKLYINDKFISFIEENDINIGKKLKKEINDDMQYVANKELKVYLFKESDLKATKNHINLIAESTTLTNLLTYILSSSGVKKVLLSPLKNLKTYNEIIIPPFTLINTLKYLENIYDGFYNNGSIIFMDFDRMYILDKTYTNTVYSVNEYKENILSILEATNTLANVSGISRDDKLKIYHINVPISSISKYNNSIVNEHINANNAIVISPKGNVAYVKPDVKEVTGNVFKLLIDRYNNKNAINEYKKMYEETNCSFNLIVEGVDLDAITPNKIFTLRFENQLLHRENGGRYRLSSMKTVMSKNGIEFVPKTSIVLNKIK